MSLMIRLSLSPIVVANVVVLLACSPSAVAETATKVTPELRENSIRTLRDVLEKEDRWVKVHAAEFLLEHGMIDMIVPRAELRETLATLLRHYGEQIDAFAAESGIPVSSNGHA